MLLTTNARFLQFQQLMECTTRTSADDGWPYSGMQNTGIGLAALVSCPACPVKDSTDGQSLNGARPTPKEAGVGRILGLSGLGFRSYPQKLQTAERPAVELCQACLDSGVVHSCYCDALLQASFTSHELNLTQLNATGVSVCASTIITVARDRVSDNEDCYILVVLFFSIHRFFDVPGAIFAKLCHTTRYVRK